MNDQYHSSELVKWQIEELLRSDITKIELPEEVTVDEAVIKREKKILTDSCIHSDYVLTLYVSEKHARRTTPRVDGELQRQRFVVLEEWKHDLGYRASVFLGVPEELVSMEYKNLREPLLRGRDEFDSSEHRKAHDWREKVPKELQPGDEEKKERIELPKVFQTG